MRTIQLYKKPFLYKIITDLRDENTKRIEFRKGLMKFGRYAGYEIANNLDYRSKKVKTGLGVYAKGLEDLDGKNIVIISVLRAAVPMAEGLIKVFPEARLGIISASRGKAPEFKIKMDYIKIPEITEKDTVIIVDPMLATGSTLSKVIENLLSYKMKRLIIFSLISANKGIRKISKLSSKVNAIKGVLHFTGITDRELNKKGYIVPGLGDAGDRAFG